MLSPLFFKQKKRGRQVSQLKLHLPLSPSTSSLKYSLNLDLGQYKKSKEIDIRNYAKYILKEGTVYEKRELLSCLKTKLILNNKELRLEK